MVGAIGILGSPGGDKDEACAQAGVASIKDYVLQAHGHAVIRACMSLSNAQ